MTNKRKLEAIILLEEKKKETRKKMTKAINTLNSLDHSIASEEYDLLSEIQEAILGL